VKSLIYGYGITGQSVEKYLIKNNIEYLIYDDNKIVYTSDLFTDNLKQEWDVIYCSPGVSRETFKNLKKLSCNSITTDIEVFCSKNSSKKIGITGTNSKSTTCFHLYQLLKKKYTVNLVGNIGEPVLDHIYDDKEYSIIELSSAQLDKLELVDLDYGVLLNIAPDHIDYHGTFKNYKNTKEKVLSAKKTTTENNPFKLYKWITGEKIENIKLMNLPFRFEFISNKVINDSKSTNIHSLEYALKKANNHFQKEPYHLILCGNPSKENYRKFRPIGPKNIFIFGNHANEIYRRIDHQNKYIFENLEEVLCKISEATSKNILFSPGHPSGNDYKNFEERGSFFNKKLKEIFSDDI